MDEKNNFQESRLSNNQARFIPYSESLYCHISAL